jgi:hypothetical protein
VFWLFGYALMFGQTHESEFGNNGFLFNRTHST